MVGSASLVARNEQSSFKFDVVSPLWEHTIMVQQILGGGGFFGGVTIVKEYKSSYFWVKAHLCVIPLQGIEVCSGTNKKGLLKDLILSYFKEQEDVYMTSNRSKALAHPLANKNSQKTS